MLSGGCNITVDRITQGECVDSGAETHTLRPVIIPAEDIFYS